MRISDWSSDVCSSDLRDPDDSLGPGRRDRAADRRCRRGWRRYRLRRPDPGQGHHQRRVLRSEEHTSELQSLMRNSYAVFCLKKNNHKTTTRPTLIYDLNTTHNKTNLKIRHAHDSTTLHKDHTID